MDLIQPGLMRRIVDEGVLGMNNNGTGDLHLILALGSTMIGLVILGGFSGSMNNVFVHMTGQNVGNEIRKDCFRKIMTFSFPQMDCFGTGSLVTRVTNDITQVQNFVAQFVRGMIRTSMLIVGSIFFMFRLNHEFGMIVLCALPFILGCMLLCLVRANPLLTRLQTQLDEVNDILQEDVSGIRMIKACVREIYEKLRFGKANDGLGQDAASRTYNICFHESGNECADVYCCCDSIADRFLSGRRKYDDTRHDYGGHHLYDTASQCNFDADYAISDHYERNCFVETGKGSPDYGAGIERRRFRR